MLPLIGDAPFNIEEHDSKGRVTVKQETVEEKLGRMAADGKDRLRKGQQMFKRFDGVRDEFYALLEKRKSQYQRQEAIFRFISYAIGFVGLFLSVAAKAVEKPGTESVEIVGAK